LTFHIVQLDSLRVWNGRHLALKRMGCVSDQAYLHSCGSARGNLSRIWNLTVSMERVRWLATTAYPT